MQEDLLQYIWQFQYFNSSELLTSIGETIQIIHPGSHNNNQGPDLIAGNRGWLQKGWLRNPGEY